MISKNNHQFYQQKNVEKKQRWGLRKLSVGVASVLLGTTFMLHSNHAVLADTEPTTKPNDNTVNTVQAGSNVADHQGSEVTLRTKDLAAATTPDKEEAVATTANAEEKVVGTNIQDTTHVGKKDTEVTPTNEATTLATQKTTAKFKVRAVRLVTKAAATTETSTKIPASAKVPAPKPTTAYATSSDWSDLTKGKGIAYYTANDDTTTITGVYNKPDATSSDWLKLTNGKAIAYYTAKGKDEKTYVTGYVGEDGKSQSIFDVDQIDPNSLEYHFIYHQVNNANNYGVWFNFADGKNIEVDGSRIKSDSLKLKSEDGYSYNWSMSGVGDGGIYYNGYADYLKNHNNSLERATQISLTGAKVKAGDTIEMTIPVKYVGELSDRKQSLDFSLHVDEYFDNGTRLIQHWSTLYFTRVRKVELHPEQIETPAKPTTDKDTVTTGIYNNPQITTSDWLKMVHGEAIAYYTAKGKDGKTYVTGYVAANGKSQSIINVKQIDLSTLEYHLIYHNGDKEVRSGLWANFADNKAIAIDTSRLGADGPQLKSQQGWSYKWAINGPKDGGIYYNSWAEYLNAHNNVGDQATNISLTGVAFKPDDTVELVIPVKYTGQLSARTPSLGFAPHINDYGNGFTQNWADLYFTTVKKDLSEVKQVVLLPTEFMGEQPGESDWKLVKEISKDMPNGWDDFKISNFPTYKGSFNMDSLPKGDLPSVVYGSAQYFIDLRQIQQIFANHGYTVKYANNNGKAQEIPFYAYSTIPLAKRVDDDRPVSDDPSIWVIQVQAVPAIILNKDQHYVADPNAKPWDTTSMIDAIYRADDPGQRQTRDQLDKLPKTDVDISYEYQAPGVATAAAVDKVDLTKAGVYTVTYSHTYADGRVVKDSRKVYVDGVKPETKDITRTIIVHAPNGTDQTVIQTATLTREVILDAPTGEIKSAGKWSTAKWEAYSAPEFKGYTPAPAQIDETTVNKDTQDTTVEISYTANETPKQETKNITRTIIVHAPNGTDQTVIQTATLTREVILDAPTGEIKSAGKWSTAKWEAYSAPEFKGYTPAPAQIDETTVNKDTQDTTVEISYTANETPKQETKNITRTIIVHAPNGTDQTVIQTATLTREVILDAPTGEIKSAGKWSTAKWEAYSAPEFKGYTPAPAQIDETTVNEDTQDTTVEISYTANEITSQPDHSKDKDKDQGQKIQTPDSNENGKHDQSTGENTEPSGSNTKTKAPVTANKVAKKLPQTGEKENQLGLLGVVLAALGAFGFGWKKREHE